MLTEEQARETWCPFAHAAAPSGVVNRVSAEMMALVRKPGNERDLAYYEGIQRDCNCLASGCQMWRWSDGPLTDEPPHVQRPLKDQRRGYCGLAGAPTQ